MGHSFVQISRITIQKSILTDPSIPSPLCLFQTGLFHRIEPVWLFCLPVWEHLHFKWPGIIFLQQYPFDPMFPWFFSFLGHFSCLSLFFIHFLCRGQMIFQFPLSWQFSFKSLCAKKYYRPLYYKATNNISKVYAAFPSAGLWIIYKYIFILRQQLQVLIVNRTGKKGNEVREDETVLFTLSNQIYRGDIGFNSGK